MTYELVCVVVHVKFGGPVRARVGRREDARARGGGDAMRMCRMPCARRALGAACLPACLPAFALGTYRDCATSGVHNQTIK